MRCHRSTNSVYIHFNSARQITVLENNCWNMSSIIRPIQNGGFYKIKFVNSAGIGQRTNKEFVVVKKCWQYYETVMHKIVVLQCKPSQSHAIGK